MTSSNPLCCFHHNTLGTLPTTTSYYPQPFYNQNVKRNITPTVIGRRHHFHPRNANFITRGSTAATTTMSLQEQHNIFYGGLISSSFTMSSDGIIAVPDGVTPIKTFEPQINTPALTSFLLISTIFFLLLTRINAIEKSIQNRNTARETLRSLKARQLDAGNEEEVRLALKAYEDALMREEELRTIIPGVARIRAPNDGRGSQEDIAAAWQFLGVDLRREEDIMEGQQQQRRQEEQRKGGDGGFDIMRGWSNGAIATLLFVALLQGGLLYLLSLDPMAANDVFNEIGGGVPPPADLPGSAW